MYQRGVAHYRDQGVVLRTYRLGEADRIVVFATRDHGKVRAVAKGVRRTRSRIGARLEPLSYVSLLLWKGRNLDTVTQVEVLDSFGPLREDLGKLSAASAIAEVADRIFQEGAVYTEMYVMLLRALSTLSTCDSPMVVPAFFLKALAADGVGLVMDVCAGCGSAPPLAAFDPAEGGALCRSCRRGAAISEEARGVMERIVSGGLAGVLAEKIPTGVVGEVRHLATEAMEHHLEARLRSIQLVEGA